MKLSDVVILPKHKTLLQDPKRIIFGEGVTNASKSFMFGIKFINRIFKEPNGRNQFVIAGKDLPTLEKMVIQNPASFYNLYKPICTYKQAGEGGARIDVITPNGLKTIYLLGYDNASRWKQILGLTVYGFNVEEINIANDDFIDELFLRVFRNGGWLLCTSNGGDPDSKVYVDYLNKARPHPKYAEQVPIETIKELERSEENKHYRYYFFNFEDNPSMSEEEKTALIENTPKGSYIWNTKILGIRGVREGVIYANYMTREKNIMKWTDIIELKGDRYQSKIHFEKLTIGIDVGGTDYTVFTLNGFTKGYEKQIVIDRMKINNANHEQIWEAFKKWYNFYFDIYGKKVYGAFIDSAAKIMRLSLDAYMRKAYNLHGSYTLQCVNAYKYRIKERIDWGITLLDQGRLIFSDRCEDLYTSFTRAIYTKDTTKTDCREFRFHKDKDNVDSVEYGTSPFIKKMLREV